MENSGNQDRPISAWQPLRNEVFRSLWMATVVSNIGTWLHSVGAAWMMTLMSESPLLVALVQAATSLPMFLFALPAGALSDMLDRRKYLIWVNAGMLTVAAALAVLTFGGLMTPWGLLTLTFCLGAGAAMLAPAWQATVPELVQPEELSAAVALNGMGINIARAIGPALGGILIAAAGPGAAFALNAASFLAILAALYQWRRTPRRPSILDERFFSSVRTGVRYVRQSPAVRAVLVRGFAFFIFASAVWALLPVVARDRLNQDASGYGLLLSAVGVGAVAGAALLPVFRRSLTVNMLVAVAAIMWAVVMIVMANTTTLYPALAAMFVAGTAWMIVLSSLNVTAQLAVPSWVRARAMSVYLLVFFGSMAGGSAIWGQVASMLAPNIALGIAGVGLIASTLLTVRFTLRESDVFNLAPSHHWPAPLLASPVDPRDGPVMVTLEYVVRPEDAKAFSDVMQEMQRIRRRDGALAWGLYRDIADPSHHIEYFIVDSWAQHLRQHERTTVSDRALQDRVNAFHQGEDPPLVQHFISAESE